MLDYSLLDFGRGRKLERFGELVLDRPEVRAVQPASLPEKTWIAKSHGRFDEDRNARGNWQLGSGFPEKWTCTYAGNHPWTVICKTGPFKHIGVFPEQEHHWAFLQKALKPGAKYLNLFAYTGAASLTAAAGGADVYHVEASKSVVNRAAQNAEASGIDSVHWVCDDAVKFAEREVKRGRKYDGVSMDPPIFGRAKGGAKWRLEDKLEGLIVTAARLIKPGGFLVLNTYSPAVTLDDMVKLCEKAGLKYNEGGTLGVTSVDGRRLDLSNYLIARVPKKAYNR